MVRIVTESDLVIPALRALDENAGAGLSTAELQPILREALEPTGEDLTLLEGRGDDRFSQKVRNLRSHSRLERDELAVFEGGRYYITEIGQRFLNDFAGVDESFAEQGFDENQKKNALQTATPLVYVEEGRETRVNAAVRTRSRALRDHAVAHFSDADGRIHCEGCGFEGSTAYGEAGLGLIEIHHKVPIAVSGSSEKPLDEALASVSPLCPTCHRIVHRTASKVMSIDELQNLIAET